MRSKTERQPSAARSRSSKKGSYANIEPLSAEILRKYPGKHIVYSEDEKRVIGVGETEAEAFRQARESGVGGLWHSAYSDPPDVYIV